jgi:hypothetical protein
MRTERTPSRPVSSTLAPVTYRNGSESAIGDALAMLPASVPTFLICGEPNRSRIAASSGTRSRTNSSIAASVVRPPTISSPPSIRSSSRPSMRSSDSTASGTNPRLLHHTPKSVAPCTITHFGLAALNSIASRSESGLKKFATRTGSRSGKSRDEGGKSSSTRGCPSTSSAALMIGS